jgi:hypothetical protein
MFSRFSMAMSVLTMSSLMVLETTESAGAAAVVTFYNSQSSFLAAISPQLTLDFEGIVPDNSSYDFGVSYHVENVTFTSGTNHMIVVGKKSQTLGEPFDSALLIPWSEPSGIIAAFDVGSNITAVGCYFESLMAGSNGQLSLIGSTGLLDQRIVYAADAGQGVPKTFYGYTVTGDTISSLTAVLWTDGPAFDNFTYGTLVPEPSTLVLLGIGAIGLLVQSCRKRKQQA